MRKISMLAAAAVLVLVGLAGPVPPAGAAERACNGYSSTSSRCINAQVAVGGTSYNADWYLPNGGATALMVLQHGFSRGCGNLRGTSRSVVEKGVMVLCLNADMTGGNSALGSALGDAIASRTLAPPAGVALPTATIVGGHSAGGHFASAVGARLAARGFAGLRGAVLFDPVASDGFSANVAAISGGGARPVLAVAARPSLANLTNNAFGALQALPNTFVGLQLVWTGFFFGVPYGGSCHTDVEGENGDVIGNAAALCTPNATQVARLRDFGSTWARDLATGTRQAAYWCTDSANRSTCGSKVRDLVVRTLPLAAPIPVG